MQLFLKIMMEIQCSFANFQKEFANLKTPNCLPACLAELCGGCIYLFFHFKKSIFKSLKRDSRDFQTSFTKAHKEKCFSNDALV